MAFVKLDTGILHSTLWVERDLREIFITSLLMAEPFELAESARQMRVRSLEETGFEVPPGWYGFVKAAGIGIVNQAQVAAESGLNALEKLGSPDAESRTQEFDGRRMVRINGGYLILNYMKYRDKDHSAAERMRNLRARRKLQTVTVTPVTVRPNVTHSRGQSTDAEAEKINSITPDGALKNWLLIKNFLKDSMSPAEYNQWLRPIYLLRAVGDTLMLTVPPANAVMEKAKKSQALQDAVKVGGYSGAIFSVYPDNYELDALRERYPEQFEELTPALKKRAGRA
jgi:hypothetical protein